MTGYNFTLVNHDYTTVKYSNDGTQQWVMNYNGPLNSDDGATALAMDKNQNVWVTGIANSSFGLFYPGLGANSDVGTVKYGQTISLPGSSCNNPLALPIGNPACIDSIAMTTSEMWFSFVADSQSLRIVLATTDTTWNVNQAALYSSCNSLINLANVSKDSSGTAYSFKFDSLTVGNIYFFRITGNNLFQPVFFKICLAFDGQSLLIFCNTQTGCNFTSDFSDVNGTPDECSPFYYNDVDCWSAAWGSPQLDGNVNNYHSAPYCAALWCDNDDGEAIITRVDVTANTWYYFSYWIKAHNGTITNHFNAKLINNPITSGTSLCTGDIIPNISQSAIIEDIAVVSPSWTYGEKCFMLPSGYTYLLLYPQNDYLAESWVEIDDISLVELGLNAYPENQTVNCGATVQLSAVLECDIPSANYSWSPIDGLDNPSIANPVACATQTRTYTVTVTTPSGLCTISDNVQINVNPLTVTSYPSDICPGQSATLTASGGDNYYWSPATGLSSTTGATVIASPLMTTTYTVTTGQGTPCACSTSVTVSVYPQPVFFIWGNTTICQGESTTLDAGAGFYGYQWSTSTSTQTISVTTGGNYSVTVTDNHGCTASATVYVTVNPKPTVYAPDVTICPGQSATLTASGGVSYQWSTGQSGSSVTVTPICGAPCSTIYSVTATGANGCTDADDVVVNVMSAPPPVILTNPGTILTCNEYAIYGFVPPPGATFYQWTTAPGATISNPTGTNTSIDWDDETVPGIVTLTVTYSNGCTASSYLDVLPCCIGSGVNDITIDRDMNAGVFGSLYCTGLGTNAVPYVFTNNMGANGILYINGEFTVDKVLKFTNSLIKMGPDAKIVIPSPTGNSEEMLYVMCTNIEAGCNKMWNGIWVYPEPGRGTTQLYMDGGTSTNIYCTAPCTTHYVRDAENAVVSVDGGIFELYCYKYLNNYKDVWVQEYSGIHLSSGKIQSCTFITQGGLISPRSGQRGHIGVELTDVTGIDYLGYGFIVGVQQGGASKVNTFENLDIGIQSERSNVNVYNNVFQNIYVCQKGGGYCGSPVMCIYGVGSPNQYTTNTLTVGSTNNGDKNIFKNSSNGIWVDNSMNMNVINNQFINISETQFYPTGRCIFSQGLYQSSINIINNKFNIFNTGIWLRNGTTLTMKINYNNFNVGSNTDAGSAAIKLQAMQQFIGQGEILNNTIRHVNIGISLTNVKGIGFFGAVPFNIYRNAITFIGPVPSLVWRYGIISENSDVYINENTVAYGGATPNNATASGKLRGIQISNSGGAHVINNQLNKMGAGIRAFGNNTNSKIECNIMTNCFRGMWWDNAAVVGMGTQHKIGGVGDPSDNQWKKTLNVGDNDVYGNPAAPAPSLYYRPTPSKFDPNPFFGLSITAIQTTGNYDCSIGCINDPCKQEQISEIINNGTQFIFYQNEHEFLTKEFAFEQLLKNDSLLRLGTPDDSVLQVFFDSVQNTNLGKIKRINRLIVTDSLPEANQLNNLIIPSNQIEHNYKTANEVYLRTWAQGKYTLDSNDIVQLRIVAFQNGIQGGNGVYLARIMLDTLLDDSASLPSMKMANSGTVTASNDSTSDNLIVKQDNENKDKEHLTVSKIYPNPTTGKMQIDCHSISEIENTYVIIYNIVGEEITNFELKAGTNNLNAGNYLDYGIYFYEVKVNTEQIFVDKLVILQ